MARAELKRGLPRWLVQSGLTAALLFELGCGAKSLSNGEQAEAAGAATSSEVGNAETPPLGEVASAGAESSEGGTDPGALPPPNPDVVKTCQSSGADWCAELASGKEDVASAVAVDSQGNVVITGYTTGNLAGNANPEGAREPFVAKYTPNGELVWLRQFGPDETGYAEGIATDADDNIVIVGVKYGAPDIQYGFLAKLTSQGERLWTRQSGQLPGSVAVDPSGNIAWVALTITGRDVSPTLKKYSPAGALLWRRELSAEDGYVTCDSAGDILLSGSEAVSAAGGTGWLEKFSATGERLWGAQSSVGFSLTSVSSSGDFFVLGNDVHWLLRRYTGLGELVWSEPADSSLFDETGIAINPRGELVIAGMSSDFKRGYDTYVVKLSADGKRLGGKALGLEGDGVFCTLALGPDGEVFVAGPLRSSAFLVRVSL